MSNLQHVKRYQAANTAKGLCLNCPRPRSGLYRLCDLHRSKEMEYNRKRAGTKPWAPGGRGRIPKWYDGPMPEKKAKKRYDKAPKPKTEPRKGISDELRELALAAAGEIQRLKQTRAIQ